jgi:hypothetical protein
MATVLGILWGERDMYPTTKLVDQLVVLDPMQQELLADLANCPPWDNKIDG